MSEWSSVVPDKIAPFLNLRFGIGGDPEELFCLILETLELEWKEQNNGGFVDSKIASKIGQFYR